MARAFILSPKMSDAGSILASSSVSNMTINNVLKARPKIFWRSGGVTAHVEGNFGSEVSIDTLFLGYIKAQEGDTFRLRLADTQSNLLIDPLFDSETSNPSGVSIWPLNADLSSYLLPHRVWTLPSAQLCAYYRIDFDFTDNTYAYVQIARISLGKRVEPVVSVQTGWEIGGNEEVVESISMGNEETARSMGVKRSHTVTWHDLTESERESIYALLLERGSAKDLILAIEPMEGAYSMSRTYIGRIKRAFSFKQTALVDGSETGQHFTVTLTVEELAPTEMV